MAHAVEVTRLAALALVLVAAGCAGDGLTAEDGPAELGPVVDVVAAALVAELGATEVPPAAGDLTRDEDDTCSYRSQTYTFPELLGIDTPLEDVVDVVAAALEDQDGWGMIDADNMPGGFVGLDADGPGDARLQVRTRTETELRIVARLDGACVSRDLPLP